MAMTPTSTRRERLRAHTLVEIRERGYEQIADGGPTALSLNGIAKAMGMSGPALYRYFASRDELLTTLIIESYEDLARTLTEVAGDARAAVPEERLRLLLSASRRWALVQPHRYRLVFGSSYGSGALDPSRIIPPASRIMGLLLAALADLGPAGTAPVVPDETFARELRQWGARSTERPLEPGVLLLGLAVWTRLHGIVSLEIEGFFEQAGVNPDQLYSAEIDYLMAQRTGLR